MILIKFCGWVRDYIELNYHAFTPGYWVKFYPVLFYEVKKSHEILLVQFVNESRAIQNGEAQFSRM